MHVRRLDKVGLGGYLAWTAVAREIYKKTTLKCFPYENYQNAIRPIKSEIFAYNPYIIQDYPDEATNYAYPLRNFSEKYKMLCLNDEENNYCKQDTPTKAIHRYDKHIIEQYCEHHEILNPQLKCELYFRDDEEKKVNEILKKMHGPFITIEPQSNDEYCVNKKYPFAKWQDIVFDLQKKGVTIVQIGQSTNDHNLLGVINLTGKTSFREAALIIGKSQLFLSTDGGLMHASNAVETPAVIVYTGFVHPRLTGYLNNTNLWIGKPHGPCGYKTFCSKCFEETQDHDHNEIVEAVMNKLKRNS